nr:uncharacterized protein LOC123765552 [Procambarus clarkii]
MAPICGQKSLSTKISSSSSQMNCDHSKQSADNLWNFSLPISRRGLFFQDSFFGHAQALFNDAVQEALGRWGETSLLADRLDDNKLRLSNNLSRYRQLREHNQKEEVLAVTASTDTTCHKIVIDVHDFMDGAVKVKVAGESEVVVEGLTNNMDSSGLSHSFTHHFTLPHFTDIKAITAVMSSDGILTITAPKTTNGPHNEGSAIPIRVEGAVSAEESTSLAASHNSTSSNTKLPESPEDECDCRSCLQDQKEQRSHTKQQRVHKIPIRINSTLVKNKCDLQTSDVKTSFNNTLQSEIKSQEESKRNAINIVTKQSNSHEDASHIQKAASVSSNTRATSSKQHTSENHANTASEIQTKKSSVDKEVRNIPLSQSSFLPITRRGQFFNDSFFEDAQKDFQNAVNEILRRWGREELPSDRWEDSNLRLGSSLSRYRQLRAHNLREENQAITITTNDTCHKIVMDVHDFMEGEVKVKVVGQKVVMVEGHTNSNTNTGDFSLTSQSFRRQFSLPDQTNIEVITAAMSSDGILTITVPKSVNRGQNNGMIIPITIEGNHNSETDVKGSVTSVSKATTSNTASDTNSKLLEVKEENCKSEECQKKECMQNKTESTLRQNEEKKFATMQKVSANSTNSSNSSCTKQRDTEVTGLVGTCGTHDDTSQQKLSGVSSKSEQLSRSHHSEIRQFCEPGNIHISNLTTLPITTRGLFFDDSFFQNAWKDFQDAVKEVVSRWGQESSTSDYLTCYRNLRTRDLKDENQAVKSSEDEFNYKFVVDVQDFTDGGEITVKAVNEKELVVEGHVEKKEGGSKFTKKFLRRFVVPGSIYLESVTSVMSSDGVLTITAPKKPETLKIKEVIVPMSVEEGTNEAKSFNQSSSHTLRASVETPASEPSTAVTIDTEENCDSPSVDVSSTLFSATELTQHDGSSTHDISSLPLDTVICSKEHVIPVQLEEELQTLSCDMKSITAKNKISQRDQLTNETSLGTKVTTIENLSSKGTTERNERTSDKSEVASTIQKVNMEGQAANLNCQTKSNVFNAKEVDKTKLNVARNIQDQRENINCVSVNKLVPISMKGSFFSDTFFEDARENFAAAVKDVLRRTNVATYLSDELSSYRNLRLRDLRSENQAFRVEEDQHALKIVVDVFDFIGGDVNVEVVGGKEVLVEGKAKRQEGTSAATQTFLLRFSLPHNVDLQGISSAMSSDGVLTVISPKIQKTVGSDASNIERTIESHSRMESHSDTGKSLQEKNMRQSIKESEGSSSRSFSSCQRSQHQYSSNKQF